MPKVALVYLKSPPDRNPMVVDYTDFNKEVDGTLSFVYKDVYAIVFDINEVIYWTQGEDSGKTTQV